MPKFCWWQSPRGDWKPSVYTGEVPRDVRIAANVRLHDVSEQEFDAAVAQGGSVLDALAARFPPPPPEPDEVDMTRDKAWAAISAEQPDEASELSA